MGVDLRLSMTDCYCKKVLAGCDIMTHDEQRIYLIRQLLAQDGRFLGVEIPEDEDGQKNLLRSLMNVRLPKPADKSFLMVQDEYLRAERDRAGIVDVRSLPSISMDQRIVLWQGDITALKVDAIVNAANSALLGCFYPLHSCVDNMIHSRSGIQLRLFCDSIMKRQGHEEPMGQAKITPAFNLPCNYILHTVGPIIEGTVSRRDCELLASCYRSCLTLAVENNCMSIAFCCISTGEFHFPNQRAASIAVETVTKFLKTDRTIQKVVFDVFQDKDAAIYQEILKNKSADKGRKGGEAD